MIARWLTPAMVLSFILTGCQQESNTSDDNTFQAKPEPVALTPLNYDFESGSSDPLILVRKSYLTDPVLSSTGLQLLPDTLLYPSLSNTFISELVIDDVQHAGGLLKIVSSVDSAIVRSADWHHTFWAFVDHDRESGYRHWGGGWGSPVYEDQTGDVYREFVAGQHSNSQITVALEVDGNNIIAPANALNLQKIEVFNYPLSDAEFSFAGLEAEFNEWEYYCGFDYQQLAATADIVTTDGVTNINGTLYSGTEAIGTFDLINSLSESLSFNGSADISSADISGSHQASGFFTYPDAPRISLHLGGCYLPLRFPIDWTNKLDESLWQSVYVADFTAVSDLAAAKITVSSGIESVLPQVVNHYDGKALELTPEGFTALNNWDDLVQIHTPPLDLPDGTGALNISLDYESSLPAGTDVCARVGLIAKMKHPNQFSGFTFGTSWASLNNMVSTTGTLNTQIFLPSDMVSKQLGITLIGEDCIINTTDANASVVIDNLTITPLVYEQHPLTGTWQVALTCLSGPCSDGSGSVSFSTFDTLYSGSLGNGMRFDAQLTENGTLQFTVSDNNEFLSFTTRFESIDGLTRWDDNGNWTMKLSLTRP